MVQVGAPLFHTLVLPKQFMINYSTIGFEFKEKKEKGKDVRSLKQDLSMAFQKFHIKSFKDL